MKLLKIADFSKTIFNKMGFNIFILSGLLGVALIFISDFDKPKTKEITETNSIEDFRENMEVQLETLISNVNGAGEVKVMLTLEAGKENIYALQEKKTEDEQLSGSDKTNQRSTYENEVVMVTAGAEKQALIEKTLQPEVQGVVIVCQGADDIKVVSDITNAVSVVLNVPSNRICVIKMK